MDSFPPGMDEEETGPFVWARYQGFLPAGSQFQPYHLTCSGLSLPMLVYFFFFSWAVPTCMRFWRYRPSTLLTPRVSKGSHKVPVRPCRKSDHLQDNRHTIFLPAMGLGFSWSPQPSHGLCCAYLN